ncbi:MAG: hypothetical protein C4289_01245 [Chloroflexota bacterium]
MRRALVTAMGMGLVPLGFYLAAFCLLTWPLITKFSTHFFADTGDGLQNVWNLWWVNKAVTELRTLPWHTGYLHYPFGISLVGHTLNPFNGFVAIALRRAFSLVQAHNVIVTGAFVLGGYTAFLLAYHLTRSYLPSVVAGYIFTFSSYHFAHAQGHLQLVSLEWVPLFILLWYMLITRPSIATAIGAAVVLFLVLLCDWYYFLYALVTGYIIVRWRAYALKDNLYTFRRPYLVPLSVFAALAALLCGPLVGALTFTSLGDPLLGAHLPEEFSLDLLGLLIYGGHWRFARLTKWFWGRLPGNINESSVHLGLSVFFLLGYVWARRKAPQAQGTGLWYIVFLLFTVLSLGPALQVWGQRVPFTSLPYGWLEIALPPLRMSGVPVRMVVMAILSAAIISATGLKLLLAGSARARLLAGGLLLLLVLEYLPGPLPASQVIVPECVQMLRDLPGGGGVLDLSRNEALGLYYQTVHGRPIALGYVARLPRSVYERDLELAETFGARRFGELRERYGIHYILAEDAPVELRRSPDVQVLYADGRVTLLALPGSVPPGQE